MQHVLFALVLVAVFLGPSSGREVPAIDAFFQDSPKFLTATFNGGFSPVATGNEDAECTRLQEQYLTICRAKDSANTCGEIKDGGTTPECYTDKEPTCATGVPRCMALGDFFQMLIDWAKQALGWVIFLSICCCCCCCGLCYCLCCKGSDDRPPPSASPVVLPGGPGQVEMEVTCPDGVGPGQQVQVQAPPPRNEMKVVTIPEGIMPGQTFRTMV